MIQNSQKIFIILIIPDLCVVVIFHQVGGGRIFNDNNSDEMNVVLIIFAIKVSI